MNLFSAMMVLLIAAGGYYQWKHKGDPDPVAKSAPAGGFLPVPPVQGLDPNTILVLAAENCPKEDAKRADKLAEDLRRSNVPVRRAHEVSFQVADNDTAAIANLNAVQRGRLPIVFVRGSAKGNPGLDEVIAQYKGTGG